MDTGLRDAVDGLVARLPAEVGSRPSKRSVGLLVTLAAIILSAAAESWRTAALAIVAAAAVCATRVRFAPYAGLAVLCATSIAALAGAGPGS